MRLSKTYTYRNTAKGQDVTVIWEVAIHPERTPHTSYILRIYRARPLGPPRPMMMTSTVPKGRQRNDRVPHRSPHLQRLARKLKQTAHG
jgi:hypothetical protein